jgi:hypothetical protein
MAGQAKDVHTVPLGDGWINEVSGARVGAVHSKQEAAIVADRALAMQNHSEHTVHGKDGKIRDKNSYGNDPMRIRG